MDLARLPELFSDVVARTGPFAPALLFGASFLEYVFPPFPGDALVLLGAWYAVHGALSWPVTFVAVTAGAIAGATVDYYAGRYLGPRLRARAQANGGEAAYRFARFEAAYQRWGPWVLVANRFLPGVRALFFVVAGATRVPYREVLLFGGLSAALWNAALLLAGAFVAKNVGQLTVLLQQYTRAAWIAVAVLAVVVLLRIAWKRRRAGAPE